MTDLQVSPRLLDRFQRVLQAEVPLLEVTQAGIEQLQGLLVAEILLQGWTSSTLAPSEPLASRTRTRVPAATDAADLMTRPVRASRVML